MGVEDETSRWEEMSRRQPPRLGSPAFTAWGDNPSARPGNEGEGVARGSGAAQQQEYMERLAGWHSSVNPQGLRDQLGGLRPSLVTVGSQRALSCYRRFTDPAMGP